MAANVKFRDSLRCFKFVVIFWSSVLVLQVDSLVVELDDSFNELIKDGRYWFVEFYAPWCGHCKKLEPLWEEVGAELTRQSSTIVTAKLDCTKFRGVAEKYEIRGYPTLKFFRGNVTARYSGSMTKDALVEFALKASRPILTEFKATKVFEKRRSKSDVFFLFVKDESEKSDEYKKIVQDIAEQKIAQVMFYSINSSLLPEDIKLDKVPNLVVFKDGQYHNFADEGKPVNQSNLSSWVDREKFLAFMFITESNINELAESGKMIVFLTFSKSKDHGEINKRLGEVGKKVAVEKYSTLGKHFQFAGLFDTDIIESITMSSAEVPFILVLNPATRVYYILPTSELSESFNEEKLAGFLDDILNGKAVAHGGRSFSQRMWRIWWDVRSSAKEIWASSPLMAVVIFGLPLLVFSFLVVMLCCLEPSPEDHIGEYEDNVEPQELNRDEKGSTEDVPVKSTRLKED